MSLSILLFDSSQKRTYVVKINSFTIDSNSNFISLALLCIGKAVDLTDVSLARRSVQWAR